MAVFKAELHNKEAVLSFYENSEFILYRVYAGSKTDPMYCRFEFAQEDKESGYNKLDEALESILQNPDNINVYLLQLLPNQSSKKKNEGSLNITFQLNKPFSYHENRQPMLMGSIGNNNTQLMELLGEMKKTNNLLNVVLNEDPQEPAETDQEEKPKTIGDTLAKYLERPEIQEKVFVLMDNFLEKVFPGQSQVTQRKISGVSEDQEKKALEAISIISKYSDTYGDDLMKIANIALKDLNRFNFLKSML